MNSPRLEYLRQRQPFEFAAASVSSSAGSHCKHPSLASAFRSNAVDLVLSLIKAADFQGSTRNREAACPEGGITTPKDSMQSAIHTPVTIEAGPSLTASGVCRKAWGRLPTHTL